jgi:predicted RND superfamily exporter protein
MLVLALTYVTWSADVPVVSRVLRGFAAGLLAMLPNIIPCIAVFGVLAWVDRGVDIGMTVAACIALGIAVDDTSHFLIMFHERLRAGLDSHAALRTAYVHSATPVVQTALICGVSMLPYMATSLVYLSRFGLLLATLMVAAMLAELLLLPALLAGPARRLFAPKGG